MELVEYWPEVEAVEGANNPTKDRGKMIRRKPTTRLMLVLLSLWQRLQAAHADGHHLQSSVSDSHRTDSKTSLRDLSQDCVRIHLCR